MALGSLEEDDHAMPDGRGSRDHDGSGGPRRAASSIVTVRQSLDLLRRKAAICARAQRLLAEAELAEAAGRAALRDSTAALAENAALRAALRAEVERVVGRLKAKQAAPEEVLVLVKAAVVEESDRAGLATRDREALTSDAVRWAIDAYYPA